MQDKMLFVIHGLKETDGDSKIYKVLEGQTRGALIEARFASDTTEEYLSKIDKLVDLGKYKEVRFLPIDAEK